MMQKRKRGRPPRGPTIRVVADIEPALAKKLRISARAHGHTIGWLIEQGIKRELAELEPVA